MGQHWELKFVSFLGYADRDKEVPIWGKCEKNDNGTGKTIKILSSLRGREELDTIIHEVAGHGTNFMGHSEEFATAMGTDTAKVLWDLGYRRLKGKDLKDYDAKNKKGG